VYEKSRSTTGGAAALDIVIGRMMGENQIRLDLAYLNFMGRSAGLKPTVLTL
jgi:hypothetical protein